MQKDPLLARQLRRLGFREFDTLFVSLTLSFFLHFHVFLLFSSFRYGADLCRSRLVQIIENRILKKLMKLLKFKLLCQN